MSVGQDKKGQRIFAKISLHQKRADAFLFLFLCSLLILAYVIPTYVHPIPTGTDAYTHLFYTREMVSASSLSSFYESCFEKNYLGYDYPFGLRLFGSIVAKITGMGMLELSRILPFMIMIALAILYYSYAKAFGLSKEQALLSVILLLSMPNICMGILGYSTTDFVLSFLIIIFYFMLTKKISLWKRVLLMNVFIFTLCFTHTGTYMFLLSFVLVYLFIYAALHGDFHRDVYMATASVMFVYIATMHLFPYVHPQYIDKGRILISVGDFISSDLHVPFSGELAQTFYEQIFVNLNPLYVASGCLSIYAICRLLMFLRSKIKISVQKIKEKLPDKFFSVPIVGSIRHVSHSVLYAPLWLGPVHVVLAAIGAFKTNKNGLCMLFSVMIVTLLPGYIGGGEGTGALREIWYFFLIIPILAALGFYHAKTKVETHTKTKLQKFFVAILLLGVFSSIVVLPVVGNLYYHPLISGANYERTGLGWLSNVGTPEEGCAGWGYRHMISVYGNKIPPSVTSVSSGSEMRRFIDDQRSMCFHISSEEHAMDLYASFGVNYQIVSERVLRNLGGTPEQLRIDYNKKLDKIYSSPKYFSIYRYIPPIIHRANITPQLNFADNAIIEDAGDSYLVDTGEYKVRLGKATPRILYIGNKTINFLGEGGIYNYIIITCSGPHSEQVNGYVLQELSYSSVTVGDNQMIYKTVLKNENRTEDWATLTVEYTFFDKALKKEIIVANDLVKDSNMNARVTTMLLTPMNHFIFQNEDNPAKKRTIYPCEDAVPLNKIKFNKIFINDNSTRGIYIVYDKTSPYPNSITYSGLTQYIYKYYSIDLSAEKTVTPSEAMHLTQWISVGDEQTAKSNVEQYSSLSLYPYPDGEIPVILTSRISSLNTTSEEDFNATLNAYEKFREVSAANYTEAVNMRDIEINVSRMSQLLEHGVYIIGCAELEGRNITVQEEKIEKMKENAQRYGIEIKGFLPKDLQYDLDTIKVLADQNLSFIVAKRIMPSFDIYFQEGFRCPQMAYYRGEATNLVLLPVSEPTIGGPTYFYDDYPTAWKAVIDSVVRNEDLCVFLWDSDKAGKPENINDTMHVIKYAKEKGMTFTTPYEIANHFLLLQNVSAVISRSDDGSSKITISVSNNNEKAVHGVTFRVKLPGTADYAVNNGQIVRKTFSGTKCIYYVSTDLAPKETKDIVLDVLGYR